jgi:signal transduction histidine kinase
MRRSLRTHLFALIVVVLVPISAFAVLLATRLAEHRRDETRSAMAHMARSITLALDRELEGSIGALTALAASSRLDAGDLAAFHRLAGNVRETQHWNAVILADLGGQQLVNTLLPPGAPLPRRGDLDAHRRAIATRRPAVSGLFTGAVVLRPVVTIEVPVIRRGAVQYVLVGSLELDAAGRLLKEATLPPAWVAAVLDRRRTVIARSRDADRSVGTPPSPLERNIPDDAASGWVEGLDREAVAAIGTFDTSMLSGWTVLITIPETALDAPARMALATAAGGMLVAVLLALALAALVGRRLSASVAALTVAARTVGDGGVPQAVPRQVSEVDDVATALRQAATLLAERARQRDETEGRLAILGDIVRSITASLDPDVVLQRVVEGARVLTRSDLATIFVRDGEREAMVPRYRAGGPSGEDDGGLHILPGRGAGGLVLVTGRPFRTDDYARDPRVGATYQDIARQSGTVALMVVPIVLRDRVEGLLYVGNRSRRSFGDDDEAICLRLADHAAIAMQNARLFATEQAARREAETANRMKDEFLATLSHELRTPLNAVLGWARMLRTAELGEARRRQALETIERNAAAQARLIDDMLDVSRIVTGKLRLRRQPLDLAWVARAAADVVRPTAESKRVELEVGVPAAAPLVGDADRLQQVVWNLLANAVKFTPTGGHVRLCVEPAEGGVRLTVADTGVGIEADLLPRIFERFWQAERRASRAGLGLGLAIVKHLVEAHGGTVSAASPGPGQGATFTVTLPAAPLDARDVEPAPAASTARHSRGDAGAPSLEPLADRRLDGLTVLVVEDEPDARAFLALALERTGAAVIAAGSVAEALDAFRRHHPAVIVSGHPRPSPAPSRADSWRGATRDAERQQWGTPRAAPRTSFPRTCRRRASRRWPRRSSLAPRRPPSGRRGARSAPPSRDAGPQISPVRMLTT